MQVFAVVDERLQEGSFRQDRGLHAMSMLMVIREYIESLPDPEGDERLLRDDLVTLTDALKDARGQAER